MQDPLEEDEAELDRKVDEDIRGLRWAAFVQIVQNFADEEGWSGVLAAVSRAMKEEEIR